MKQALELTELTGQQQFSCEQAGDEGAIRVCVCAHAHVCAQTHAHTQAHIHYSCQTQVSIFTFSGPRVESYCVL